MKVSLLLLLFLVGCSSVKYKEANDSNCTIEAPEIETLHNCTIQTTKNTMHAFCDEGEFHELINFKKTCE